MPTSFPMALPHFPSNGTMLSQAGMDTYATTPINDLYALFAAGPQGLLSETVSSSATTLAVLSTVYSAAGTVSFTLATTRRVRIDVHSDFTAATAPARYLLRPAYNSGGTVGTPTQIGIAVSVVASATGAAGTNGAFNSATVLLTAGTYTAYAGLVRLSGGSATDTGASNGVHVYDEGAT